MNEEELNKRFDRIETKVDKLVDTLSTLVRMEEKMSSHSQGMQRLGARVDDLEYRLEVIEKRMPLINLIVAGFGKVGISVISIITLGIVGSFFVFK